MSFISFNKNQILINNKQYTIFIGNLNIEKNYFFIEFFLYFQNSNSFNNELKDLSLDYKNYIKDKLTFYNESKYDDCIIPLFSNDKILGNIYKYNSAIKDYSKFPDYSKYFKNELLINIISLYSYYKQIKIKKSIDFEKYYLINEDFINKIKIESGYKQIYDELEKNPQNISIFEEDNSKILFCLLKSLPENMLNEYINKKITNKKYDNKNFNIEPLLIPIYYYDNNIKENKTLMIYNNFEIIKKNIIELFIRRFENTDILAECFFNKGKILINIPNHLNNNHFISLIGTLDNYFNNFKLEYVFVYNKETDRKNHIKSIIFNLNDYLDKLILSNNICSLTIGNNYDIIGTIIKFENIDNNSNKININKENINNINIKNNYNDKNKKSLESNFKCCPNIGLQNIGATCYMNSTLQCFCHIPKFVEFFKYSPQLSDIFKTNKNNNKNLSVSFKTLIDNLWPDDYNLSPQKYKDYYYAPEDFKNKISRMNPLFEGIAANDAKDLVNFIIMTLHLELNKIIKINENKSLRLIDQTNSKLMFEVFSKEFAQQNHSIISDLFYGVNCNTTQCCKCNTKIYNYQTYFFIVFPLEEVRKFKNNINSPQILYNNFFDNNIQYQLNNFMMNQNQYNNFIFGPQNQNYIMNPQNQYNNLMIYGQQNQINNINENNKEVSIYDCFNYDKKENFMSGDNSMFCNKCRMNNNCIMKTNLVIGPEILILLLNRGKGIEFDVKINFTDFLDLKDYIEYKNTGVTYKLFGVITHLGESSMEGHFIAYCFDHFTKKWHKFNDSFVTEVIDFQKEVINFAMPYLLFYQKINN